ncbi:Ser-Thr-rich glycosyl-phosphatidyl-inositol-anchored membrane family-domain-containing protein [Daldinia sp. FL1419]|nr:Ser-Thr-rich glycosyl-phosphatidyl-inositol-anchored membrane family-domain-containing protein [Daldinia sp. FL1419]
MRSTTVFASALAFAASAFAQTPGYAALSSPAEGQQVASGKTFTIKWDAGKYSGPATITLLGGETPTTLTPGPVIATVDVTEGSFAWNVDCSLGKEKTYGIKIASVQDAATFQYSFPFAIAGPSCSSGAGEYPSKGSSSAVPSSSAGGYPTEGYPTQGYPTAPSSSSAVVSSSSSSSSSSSKTSSAPSYPTAPAPSSSVVVSNTTSASSTNVPTYPTVVPSGNLSTTAQVPTYAPTTIITSSSYAAVTPVPSATTSGPATIPTAGASNVAAGSLALVGGLAFALLGM